MFRRLEGTEPKDPKFPADLRELGYFINQNYQVRQIKDPQKGFHFFISKNERVLEVQREAFNTCIREEIQSRLLGPQWPSLCQILLPIGIQKSQPHVPIWMSANTKKAKRLILCVGETHQDIGILAWRLIENNISHGSIIDFVKEAQGGEDDDTAILVANMGQLLWYRGGKRAVTLQTWNALPRIKGTDPPMWIDDIKNRIPGNKNPAQHLRSIFEQIIPSFIREDAKIQIAGIGDGAVEVAAYLESTWEKWAQRVSAIAVATGSVWPGNKIKDKDFKSFWSQRARAYVVSDEPVGSPLTGHEEFGCNVYSGGESAHSECVMPNAFNSILQFFKLVNEVPGYRELEALPLSDTTNTAKPAFSVTRND